jgi:hypothetical protein
MTHAPDDENGVAAFFRMMCSSCGHLPVPSSCRSVRNLSEGVFRTRSFLVGVGPAHVQRRHGARTAPARRRPLRQDALAHDPWTIGAAFDGEPGCRERLTISDPVDLRRRHPRHVVAAKNRKVSRVVVPDRAGTLTGRMNDCAPPFARDEVHLADAARARS